MSPVLTIWPSLKKALVIWPWMRALICTVELAITVPMVRSITAMCGNDYMRVRLGVGHPGQKELVQAYVLSDFFKEERPWVEAVCEAVADAAEFLVKRRPEEFQNRVHLSLQARGVSRQQPSGFHHRGLVTNRRQRVEQLALFRN